MYWRQKNGKVIAIDEMDIDHLRNVLKMIVRNNQKKRSVVMNGDIASQDHDKFLLYQISPELTCECTKHSVCQQCLENY